MTPWAAGVAISVVLLTGCGTPVAAMPNVKGDPLEGAITGLEESGFVVELEGVDRDENLEPWIVSAQDPRPGEVEIGATVTLKGDTVLDVAAGECSVAGIGDGGRSLTLNMEGDDYGSGELAHADVMCVLGELEVPDVVLDKMGATRSLDGRQSDEWGDVEASWSYHPDNGLDVILELAP